MHDDGVNSEMAAQRRGRFFWLLVATAVVVLDQITKYFANTMLDYASPVEIFPVLNITLHYNPGAAFSFLSDAGGWQRWLFSVIALAVSAYICVWLMRLRREQWLLSLALALVLGGALGNLWDRLFLGYVIDFVSVHWGDSYFPTFNIADAGISVGACLLLLDMVVNPESENQHE
ncbi:signal peptidase II [Zhongshania sp.]|jgi:signal peptidase II|uniref:signal peptidase II n=1 Tax=Zhongshania sp. TaxID=1971902 RepID=UPI0039E24D92